jgi:hypothetical protein
MRLRLVIEEVFELPRRRATVVVGRLEGVVSPGMTLRDEKTGGAVTIPAVELVPANNGRVSLAIDPAGSTRPVRGMVLVATS